MKENEEIRQRFFVEAAQPKSLNNLSSKVTCYRGNRRDPEWKDIEPGKPSIQMSCPRLLTYHSVEAFSTLCTIYADTSRVAKQKSFGTKGFYYTQNFDIVLSCGLTEMKAQISWMENVRGQVC